MNTDNDSARLAIKFGRGWIKKRTKATDSYSSGRVMHRATAASAVKSILRLDVCTTAAMFFLSLVPYS